MRDQKARKANGWKRVKARECKNDLPEMGVDEGWHVGFETVTRIEGGGNKRATSEQMRQGLG